MFAAKAAAVALSGAYADQRLHALLADEPHLRQDPVAAAYFYAANGQPHPVGHLLRNPELAHVLRLIATRGARGLLEGDVGARSLLEKHAAEICYVPMDDGGVTLDVDTPEALLSLTKEA